jgi:hypothetical protein
MPPSVTIILDKKNDLELTVILCISVTEDVSVLSIKDLVLKASLRLVVVVGECESSS